MRQWRVGTFSMGLVLIMTGVVLLGAQFKEFSALKIILHWWPLILVILGTEILLYLKFVKDDQPRIKYDFLSVIFILLLGGLTFGLYGLTTTDALSFFSERVLTNSYTVPLPEERLTIPAEAAKIQVTGPRQRLKVLAVNANELVSFGEIEVQAISEEQAFSLLPENIFNSSMVGDTLFLEFRDISSMNHRGHYFYGGTITLILPDDIPVELETNNYNPMELRLDNLQSDWLIKTRNSVEVLLAADANLEVTALVCERHELKGTAIWAELDGKIEDDSNAFYQGFSKLGEGGHKLRIIGEGDVIVNTI